jgi:hypothetical protein
MLMLPGQLAVVAAALVTWLVPGKDKTTAGSFFQSTVNSSTGIGQGMLSIMWRLNHDSVGNVLKPSKPMVANTKAIALKKGQPTRVAWP